GRVCWAGSVLGLACPLADVQSLAAGDAPAWSLPWLAAWLLDPTVSLVLLAILRAEQGTARYQVATGPWVRRAKWFTLSATYVMTLLCLSRSGRLRARTREVTDPKSWRPGCEAGRAGFVGARVCPSGSAHRVSGQCRGGVEGAVELAG